MQELPQFAQFQTLVQSSLAGGGRTGNARQALSQHTTSACQPRKSEEAGVNISLKSAGLEAGMPANGGTKVIINLPCAFNIGGGIQIEYGSPMMPNLAAAQKQTCVDLLSFLLVVAPWAVKVHPSNWKQPQHRSDPGGSNLRT